MLMLREETHGRCFTDLLRSLCIRYGVRGRFEAHDRLCDAVSSPTGTASGGAELSSPNYSVVGGKHVARKNNTYVPAGDFLRDNLDGVKPKRWERRGGAP